jgi:hypothetical protein
MVNALENITYELLPITSPRGMHSRLRLVAVFSKDFTFSQFLPDSYPIFSHLSCTLRSEGNLQIRESFFFTKEVYWCLCSAFP